VFHPWLKNKNMISISIIKDTATPAIRGLLRGLTPERLAARLGPPLEKLTKDHLAALGPNKRGWPTTHFYKKYAPNVKWIPRPDGMSIAIPPAIIHGREAGLGLRVYGGGIVPQRVSMLAIPISPVSYGHVPGDFSGLFVVRTTKGAFLCQHAEVKRPRLMLPTGVKRSLLGANSGRPAMTEINFLFQLRASVVQSGDRDVLPSNDEYQATAIKALTEGMKN
jgi:hypothetical protein